METVIVVLGFFGLVFITLAVFDSDDMDDGPKI